MRSHVSRSSVFLLIGLLVALAIPRVSEARLVRLEVQQRESFAGGAQWGASGAFERLRGIAYMEVDPLNPVNSVIVDLEKAPRNAHGMVEFSTQFVIVKPLDIARGNHKIFYTVNNRGGESLLSVQTAAQVTGVNDLALRQGYTIVDAGWQGDITRASGLGANLPIATQPDGSPIIGPLRVEYSDWATPLAGTFTLPLQGNSAFRSYETADTNTAHSTFTVRNDVNTPRIPIPSDRWAFGSCPTGAGSLVPSTVSICYLDGFQGDKLYELIYPAKNPFVAALGHATTRDFASFLRYQTKDDVGNPNPLAPTAGHPGIRRAYATGCSQTGGYLRDFIYLGFNEDESNRKAFDGIMPLCAGSIREFINTRFANADQWASQDHAHDYPLNTSYPPFTYAVTADPLSGIHDGILKRPATDPLVIQLDSSWEDWQLHGSFSVADGLGNSVPLPDNARIYVVSSTGHGFTGTYFNTPPSTQLPLCQYPIHGGSVPETQKAVLVMMDEWADRGIEPPKSNLPTLQKRTLVSLEEARAAFPSIPGVSFPNAVNEYNLPYFGSQFTSSGGVITVQPPALGPSYKVYVGKTDEDGLDIGGVQPMHARVPLGTNTGWNVRATGHRPGDLCSYRGAYFPFAQTKADRLANGDPRRSVEERYKNHEGFVKAVKKAAKDLVRERFLLQEDADAFIGAAEASDVLK